VKRRTESLFGFDFGFDVLVDLLELLLELGLLLVVRQRLVGRRKSPLLRPSMHTPPLLTLCHLCVCAVGCGTLVAAGLWIMLPAGVGLLYNGGKRKESEKFFTRFWLDEGRRRTCGLAERSARWRTWRRGWSRATMARRPRPSRARTESPAVASRPTPCRMTTHTPR
jgi:hypothetical protein